MLSVFVRSFKRYILILVDLNVTVFEPAIDNPKNVKCFKLYTGLDLSLRLVQNL